MPEGPLSLLRRAVQRQQSVRVVTRHARGVRGVAIGMLSCTTSSRNMRLQKILI